MEFSLRLELPRDAYSVPVARRVLKNSLAVLGVTDEIVHDIEIALTEACTNVLDHATDSDDYEVTVGIDGTVCVIEVVDRGQGFDGSTKGLTDAEPGAEDGRGIQLMRALVDKVTFTSQPKQGAVVHLEKQLEWSDEAVVKRLSEEARAAPDAPELHDGQRTDAAEPVRQRR